MKANKTMSSHVLARYKRQILKANTWLDEWMLSALAPDYIDNQQTKETLKGRY